MNQIYHADCLDILRTLPDKSVDAVITDPPYGYLKHKLDCPFDAQAIFTECHRIIKDTGFLLFFGRGFEFAKWNVLCSELGFIFKEELIWYKKRASSPMNPLLRVHESANLFGKQKSKLNKVYIDKIGFDEIFAPANINQDYKRILSSIKKIKSYQDFIEWGKFNKEDKIKHGITKRNSVLRRDRAFGTFNSHQKGAVLRSILPVGREHYQFEHPTQKPVKLFKQLIELTTKENDLVVDPFAGSFTTAISCLVFDSQCSKKQITNNKK
jgi:site-specific DNA-methyltransferase (adenine-specific)